MSAMSGLHVVKLDKVAPQPWRNGGGITRELLAWPPGSGTDWQLRVSVADIERDGPFSPYPGVQRCFTVLDGAGVVLGFGGEEHRLDRESLPIKFDGACAPGCRLLDGPTRDLNLMAREAAGQASLAPALTGQSPAAPAAWWGLYVASSAVLSGPAGALELPPHSLAWADCPAPAWRLGAFGAAPLRAWWLRLVRHA